MEQVTLAEKAGVSVETIKRLEAMDGALRAQFDTISKIKHALELSGIEFVTVGDAPGCVLAKDRLARARREISEQVAGLLDAALEARLIKDPNLFAKGPEYVIQVTEEILPGLLRHTIPKRLKELWGDRR